jgi:hypothetical protein
MKAGHRFTPCIARQRGAQFLALCQPAEACPVRTRQADKKTGEAMPRFTDSGLKVMRALGVELPGLWCKSIDATELATRSRKTY